MGAVVSSDDDEARRSEDDSEEGEEGRNSDEDESESEEDSSGDEESGEEDDDDDDEESSFFGDSDSDSDTTESESDDEIQHQEVIITEGILIGCGAPTLNILANVAPGYLKRYELREGDEKESSESAIFDELIDWFQVKFLPGGEALTTIRVAQWMLHLPKATSAIGAIGNDSKGKQLLEICENFNITTSFQVQEDEITGAKACLNTKTSNPTEAKETSVVNISAGNTYSKQRHLDQGSVWTQIATGQYYFCSGYFLSVCPETVLAIGAHSSELGKTFALSLGDPKFSRLFKDSQLAAIRYVDFLFANKEEALSFGKENDFGTADICEIARRMCLLPKVNSNKSRVVVITQGAEPTVVARGYDEVHEFEVDEIELNHHVDGVGSFFMGGFLSQLVQGHGLERCVEGAHYCSRQLITSGPHLDSECPFQ